MVRRRIARRVLPLNAMNTLRATLFLLAATASSALASDWPHFLGPQSNSTSTETGLVDSIPASGLPIIWRKEIGPGYGAPSIREGKLVIYHRIKNEEITEALDPATGKTLWRQSNPSSYVDPYGYNNGPRSTPLLTSDRCYTFGAEGLLSCLNLADGSVVWRRDTAKEFNVPEAFFGVGSTPLLDGNLLITMVGAQTNSGVVAFDATTGKTVWESVGAENWTGQPMYGWPGERTVVWKTWDKQASYSSPVAATIQGKRVVLCLMRQGLVALDAATGKVFDSFWFRATVNESVNAMNPVVSGNFVFISAAYYHIGSVLLEMTPDMKFKQVWRSTVLELHWNTPILNDDYLYAFSGRDEPDAMFRCVNFKTGEMMWSRDEMAHKRPPHGTELQVFGRGSAILAEGKLFVIGEGGMLGLFKPNPKQIEEVSRWQVPDFGYPCWAAPVLSNKRLYLRNESQLVCLDVAR
ncbi:PQQ-binding-like beta-propeller repeat protein [bacterium]|nr:PQQ-binding-like beta-propeller repeat protein [bacterium]